MQEIEVPVLIVGAGPVGLLGARLLGSRGVGVLLAEKYETRLETPKAHALNPRSLEICAAAELPMDTIHAAATPTDEGAHVRMVTSLAGQEIGALPYERQDEAVRAVTPFPLINIEQPRFEAILEASLAGLPDVEVRRGLEWTGCDQLADAVISTLVDRATGETVKVRSRYLIATDGAGSTVRDKAGVQMDGPAELQHNMMIHFEADLRQAVAGREAILYFLFGPGANGVLIAYDIGRTWVLMHTCRPGEAFDEAACRRLVLDAVGAEVPVTIKGARPWVMSAQVAKRYRTGQVFLAGDAAHRFPPTGGLGLNTGIADIDNLAWKIAAVEAGWAAPALLDTYEAERQPVARTNMGQSLANAMRLRTLLGALGYGPDQTVDAATFAHRLHDPEARAQVDAAVAFQKDHFDSLRLQLGYAYGGALDADGQLPISLFEPKAVAGARLPHALLADGRSTLDLVAREGFTLISASEQAIGFGAPLAVLVAGRDFEGWTPGETLLVRPDGHILATGDAALDALAPYLGTAPALERVA